MAIRIFFCRCDASAKNLVNLFKAFDAFKNENPNETKLVIVGNKMYWRKDLEEAYSAIVNLKTKYILQVG